MCVTRHTLSAHNLLAAGLRVNTLSPPPHIIAHMLIFFGLSRLQVCERARNDSVKLNIAHYKGFIKSFRLQTNTSGERRLFLSGSWAHNITVAGVVRMF